MVEHEERRRRSGWRALLLLPVAMMALAVPFVIGDSLDTATTPGPVPVAGVDFEGERWVPSGTPLSMPDAVVQRIGQSRDGRFLYGVRPDVPRGGGGGAGERPRLAKPLIYVRVADGTYQPLVPR